MTGSFTLSHASYLLADCPKRTLKRSQGVSDQLLDNDRAKTCIDMRETASATASFRGIDNQKYSGSRNLKPLTNYFKTLSVEIEQTHKILV